MSESEDDPDFVAEVAEVIAAEFDHELKALPNGEFMAFIAAAKAAIRKVRAYDDSAFFKARAALRKDELLTIKFGPEKSTTTI